MAEYTIYETVLNVKFKCRHDQYILDAAEEAGFDYPYSSRAGMDTTSACRLLSGRIDVSDNHFLDGYDTALGYFLMDTTYPMSDCIIKAFVEDDITHSLSNGSRAKRDFGPIKKRIINM